MTGFASGQGAAAGHDWSWDIRSVNGKGFDLRLRLPEIEGLEAAVRSAVAQVAARGNITLNLRVTRSSGAEAATLNPAALHAAIAALVQVQEAARDRGLELAPSRGTDLLALRGVMEAGPAKAESPEALKAALLRDLTELLTDFRAMRVTEGGEIGAVIVAQLDQIAALTEAAAAAAEARRPESQAALRAALARVIEGAPGADPDRVAQELALIAVKGDVTEELDRLRAHVTSARALVRAEGPVGRKLDFLTQEFVREANTLCSKSGSTALTAIGLDLKAVIDQMREQVQNLE
ncbi:MAG: YicC family protein [Sphingomonadales bacterium]|nr:YicC family protein [Sphingomonadales bacterium]